LLTSLAGGLAMFFAAVPKIIAFALILVIGWFIATLIARVVAALPRAVHFNQAAERSGSGALVRNAGGRLRRARASRRIGRAAAAPALAA
jgi:hypothetical protein